MEQSVSLMDVLVEAALALGVKASDRCRRCGYGYGSRLHRAKCIDADGFAPLRNMRGWSRRAK